MGEGHGFEMAYTVIFENAMADFDCTRGAEGLRLFENGQVMRVPALEPGDGYSAELSYMIECIAKGQSPSVVTAGDGASAVEICEAEAESIRSGKLATL